MNKHILIKTTFLFILCFYLAGYFFTGTLWGTHHLSLTSIYTQVIILTIAFLPFVSNHVFNYLNNIELKKSDKLIIAVLAGIIILFLPIYSDIYGDSQFIRPQISKTISAPWIELLTHFLSFNIFDSKMGTSSFYDLTNIISKLTNKPGTEILPFLQALCYSVFVIIWINLIDTLSDSKTNLFLYLIVILSPVSVIFSAHFEIYFLPIIAISFYLLILIKFLKNPNVKKIILLSFAFILSVKFHITALLLFPSLGYSFLLFLDKKQSINWKKLFIYSLLFTFISGIIIYFFITKSAFSTRAYTSDTLEDHLFLPLKTSEEAPLNRYNLFSFSHVLDYFNMFFNWSSASLFLILTGFIFRKKITLKTPLNSIILFTTILFIITFFVINPLLSMPTDWDLFSIPTPIFIILSLVIFTRLSNTEHLNLIKKSLFTLTVIGGTIIIVNSQPKPLQKHFEYTGIWNYQTYWIGSSTWLIKAAELLPENSKKTKYWKKVTRELKPFAVIGNDLQYAEMLNRLGRSEIEQTDNYLKALEHFEEAYKYRNQHTKNLYSLVMSYYTVGNINRAVYFLPKYSKTNYPSAKKALRISIHIAIEAKKYKYAKTYCNQYLIQFPNDNFIKKVLAKINSNEKLHELKTWFNK
jgi:hypothetical protein